MIQWSQLVYIDETDSSYGCPFDQYEVTTYLGNHITSCEVRLCGELHSTAVVWKGINYDLDDLSILHQETLEEDLRDHTITYMVLYYYATPDLHWFEYDVIDSFELEHKATKRGAYRFRYCEPEAAGVTQYILEVYACGKKYKQKIIWKERDETLRYLLNVALHDDGWSSCECCNIIDKGYVADNAA